MTFPKIAVISPYCRESADVLRQCHQSVCEQTIACHHYLVADGIPNEIFLRPRTPLSHVVLPRPHGDYGNAARSLGGLLAESEGYDFISFLDADNWYWPQHIESLIEVHRRTGAAVLCAKRTFHREDASQIPIHEIGEDEHSHVDTSCFMLSREAFVCLDVWRRMPVVFGSIGDRIFRLALQHARLSFGYSDKRTVAFRTRYQIHYEQNGENAPPHCKSNSEVFQAPLAYLQQDNGIAATVAALGFYPTLADLVK